MSITVLRCVSVALLVAGFSGPASADVNGTTYDAMLGYGTISISNSEPLTVGTLGELDEPVGQLWSIVTTANGNTLSSELNVLDATSLLADSDVSLTLAGINDPEAAALFATGVVLIWFTPQMQPTDAIPLFEGAGWTQVIDGNSFDLTLNVNPFEATDGELFAGPDDEITDIHVLFQVVPEPGSAALLLVGAATLIRRRRGT